MPQHNIPRGNWTPSPGSADFTIMRRGPRGTRTARPAFSSQAGSRPQAQPNFLMSLINKIPWHPSYLLNHVNNAMQNAQNGGGQ
jgi:hypothetical protein